MKPKIRTRGNQKNHPKKGSRITVEPIKNIKDIEAIKKILSEKPRDLLLFIMGISTTA